MCLYCVINETLRMTNQIFMGPYDFDMILNLELCGTYYVVDTVVRLCVCS